MTDNNTNQSEQDLYKAILSLRNADECQAFLRDLCTLSEIQSMTERLQVAKMINDNISYREAAKSAKSSTATVTRVAHWLHHGMGGYKLVLERMK